MATRSEVFSDLGTKFVDWLKKQGPGETFVAAPHYRNNLAVIGKPVQPHTSPTGKWFGLYEVLTGDRPKVDVFAVKSIAEFAAQYGKVASFFAIERKPEQVREQIRPLYPNCAIFDEVFDFAYTSERGDGGHTRKGYEKYCQFLCELEAMVSDGVRVALYTEIDEPYQRIIYGAPGTGKSHKVDEIANKLPKEDVVRTTFHPDSDYSTFVGAYKPTMDCVPRVAMDGTTVKKATFDAGITANEREKLEIEKRISYSFVPQAFAKAYVQAWKRMAVPGADGKIAPVMLVIEEINRGDCAKVFGDLFQLLDRRVKDDEHDATKKAGFSEYPVLADSDLAEFIRGELSGVKAAIEGLGYASVVADDKLELMLPPNMYIWATMNTSDQSLFPMDSAFKRRWDWKYVPIKNHKDKHWALEIGTDRKYDWWDFLTKINEQILHATNSEDKQLGYFFVNSQGDVVSLDTFVNKVMFYLWNVVFKDCYTEYDFFKDGSDYLTFTKFFDEDGKPIPEKVSKFLDALKVAEWTAPAPSAAPATPAPADPATEGNSTEADAAVPQS